MSTNKIAFNDIESGIMQDITRKFIDNHIIYNQSYLVSELMSKEVISLEDEFRDEEGKEVYIQTQRRKVYKDLKAHVVIVVSAQVEKIQVLLKIKL